MKKFFLIIFILLLSGHLKGQYQLSFTGSGASAVVDSVKVINLMQNTSLNMGANNILVLDLLVGDPEYNYNPKGLSLYPNPFSTDCNLEFYAVEAARTSIEILAVNGRIVLQSDEYLDQGRQKIRITNLHSGVYFVRIFSEAFHYCGKIISLYEGNNFPEMYTRQVAENRKTAIILPDNFAAENVSQPLSYIHMNYYAGDRLLLTGKSGHFKTIVTLVPNNSQNVDFLFVPCTDADGNHYPVVHIGNQTWMASNLKTTHYRNGDSIPQAQTTSAWTTTTTDAYCNFNNSPDSTSIYGRLYNWYALCDTRKLAPAGWRVTSKDDMDALAAFLGGTSVAGGKMKETTLLHWNSPNAGASNASGFTALPGGSRSSNGNFNGIRNYIALWTSSFHPGSPSLLYYYDISILGENLSWHYANYNYGLSLRCILGEFAALTTDSVNSVTSHGAKVYGNVVSPGTSPVTEKGFCWSLSTLPTKANAWVTCGSGNGSFSGNISGLMSNTAYHVRAYATNATGTSYGDDLGLQTLTGLPFFNLLPLTNITPYTATTGGSIDTTGGFVSDTHGVCWSLDPNSPSVADSITSDGAGTGTYVSQLTHLQPGKTYNVRAYSINACGILYAGYETFTAPVTIPELTTTNFTGYTFPVATSGGNITYDGGAPITERGVCWSFNYPPTIGGAHTSDGTGTGVFTSSISGPIQNTHYYVRAYATNSAGTAYGNVIDLYPQLQLGQPYQGGVIAYFDAGTTNSSGLITTVASTIGQAEWGCYGLWISTLETHGSGMANTLNIVNACADPGIAARLCNDLVLNGYSDWYLPSIDELWKLYDNRNIIGYIPAFYWSSSQTTNGGYSMGINFYLNLVGQSVKTTPAEVRPVRNF